MSHDLLISFYYQSLRIKLTLFRFNFIERVKLNYSKQGILNNLRPKCYWLLTALFLSINILALRMTRLILYKETLFIKNLTIKTRNSSLDYGNHGVYHLFEGIVFVFPFIFMWLFCNILKSTHLKLTLQIYYILKTM